MASPVGTSEETWADFSPAPALMSSSMESTEDGNEESSEEVEEFDFQHCPSVFKSWSREIHQSQTTAGATGGAGPKPRTHKMQVLDLAHLGILQFPVADQETAQDDDHVALSCRHSPFQMFPRDLFQLIDDTDNNETANQTKIRDLAVLDSPLFPLADQNMEATEDDDHVELSCRPSPFQILPRDMFQLTDDIDKNKDRAAYESDNNGVCDNVNEDPLGGWINQMIPSETPSSLPTFADATIHYLLTTPPSTPPPPSVRLRGRRDRFDHNTNIHYQSCYNAIGSGAASGEHLSNEEWTRQRRIRERRQHRRRLEREREEERAGNGTQLVFQDGEFQPLIVERLQEGDRLLRQQQLQEQQRLQMEILQAVADQEEGAASPQASPDPQRRRNARRLPITIEARREQISHWSTTILRRSWRLLKSPFVALARKDRPLATEQVIHESGPGIIVVEPDWALAMAYEGGRGWHWGQESGHGDSASESMSQSTAYFSTGTAVVTEWDSESSSDDCSASSSGHTSGVNYDEVSEGFNMGGMKRSLSLPHLEDTD